MPWQDIEGDLTNLTNASAADVRGPFIWSFAITIPTIPIHHNNSIYQSSSIRVKAIRAVEEAETLAVLVSDFRSV